MSGIEVWGQVRRKFVVKGFVAGTKKKRDFLASREDSRIADVEWCFNDWKGLDAVKIGALNCAVKFQVQIGASRAAKIDSFR